MIRIWNRKIMGIHIAIRKMREDGRAADYEFVFRGNPGLLRLDKRTGTALLIDVDPLDVMAFRCARLKLREHWLKGELPDRTSWAA
jgi:hypothetical protein